MPLWIKGKRVGSAEPVQLFVEGNNIQAGPGSSIASERAIGGKDHWVTPAFFDIQVNGFAGVDFNTTGLQPDDCRLIVSKLREKGVVLFCPTVITHSFEHQWACLKAIARACHDSTLSQSIPCIHLEGPYLSREEGPRGAHPAEHIRRADWTEFLRLQDAAEGRIGMVTVAPEVPAALRLIEKLTEAGIVVAIGHTAAEPQIIRDAIRAGAKTSTHLGNGSHVRIPRHHNYIWEQLAADELRASFIVDGHHLPPSVVKCMIRAKGCRRSILTSDAISAAGMPPGNYRLGKVEVVVHPNCKVERIDLAGTGILAGSALDLLRGVENVINFAGVSLADAVAMASTNPAELMGISSRLGSIEPGCEANLLVFEKLSSSQSLDLKYAIQAGEIVFASA
jgi:N-acetylglucosamine-6-phosphate deacetylase